jgi:hypothetical protein
MDALLGHIKHFVRWFFNTSPTWHDNDIQTQNLVKGQSPIAVRAGARAPLRPNANRDEVGTTIARCGPSPTADSAGSDRL